MVLQVLVLHVAFKQWRDYLSDAATRILMIQIRLKVIVFLIHAVL